jgi:hypothetical protein
MPPSELGEPFTRSHREGSIKVSAEVGGWNLVHQVSDGIGGTPSGHLVVTEALPN